MLTKIIFTAVVILAVIYGYRMFARLRDKSGKNERIDKTERKPAVDLKKCGPCGKFVDPDQISCERADCPYG